MAMELNSILLNEVVHAVLFLILVVIYINTLIDHRTQKREKDRAFSLFVLFCAIYVGLMLIWLPIADSTLRRYISVFRVFSAMVAYSYSGIWLISVIEEKQPVAKHIKLIFQYGIYVLFALSYLMLYLTDSEIVANVPIMTFYLLLGILVACYNKALGKFYTAIIPVFIIPILLLQVQEWWNYTPANIYLTVAVLFIYCRMWSNERQKLLKVEKQLQEDETKLVKYKTEVLLSQIGPHFVYNTLSTIAALCATNPDKAQKLTVDFSTYLREDLNLAKMQQLSPFDNELKHTMKYLEIEKVRFGKRLNVEYDIKETAFELPSLSLQPIVENAVKHGIMRKTAGGTVRIATKKMGDLYAVTVSDDGVGCTHEEIQPKEGHYGLPTTRERLKILLDGNLTVDSTVNQGTTVTILVKAPKGKSIG